MTELSLTILPETADDAVAIERLHERTFGPGRLAKSAYRLREGHDHSLDLSFTARIGTLLVGSVRLSTIRIGDDAGAAARAADGRAAVPRARHRPGADRARARGGEGARPPPGGAGRRRALLRQARLQDDPEGAGEDAGPGRSGAAPGLRAGRRRVRGRFRADPAGLGDALICRTVYATIYFNVAARNVFDAHCGRRVASLPESSRQGEHRENPQRHCDRGRACGGDARAGPEGRSVDHHLQAVPRDEQGKRQPDPDVDGRLLSPTRTRRRSSISTR